MSVLFILFSLVIIGGVVGAADKEEVVIWYYWETELHQQSLSRIINGFNQSQEDIVVSAKYVPFADFKKQLSIGAAVAELPDLVIIDNPDHASYAAMGIFADITDKMKGWDGLDQYYDGPLNSAMLNDSLYGLPFGSNCIALYYNEDMLEAAGAEVPTTWDELVEAARLTTKGNVKGFAMSSLQNEEGTFNLLPWVWSAGATAYDIDNSKGIKALSYLHKLLFQPFIENALVHGYKGNEDNFHLTVRISTENETLKIIIGDNGRGISTKALEEINKMISSEEWDTNQIGIMNAIERVKLYYGEEAKVIIDSELNIGTTIYLYLPIE